MTRALILSRLDPLIRRVARLAPEEALTPDTGLIGSGLHLDSISGLELLLAVEQEFDLELDGQDLFEQRALQTVGHLADYLAARSGGQDDR